MKATIENIKEFKVNNRDELVLISDSDEVVLESYEYTDTEDLCNEVLSMLLYAVGQKYGNDKLLEMLNESLSGNHGFKVERAEI